MATELPRRLNPRDAVRDWFAMRAGSSSWAKERRVSVPWLIALNTFGILVLELALIRWTSGQMRAFAYFNNLVLIVAFLGMGVGVALGRARPGLVYFTLPLLLLVAVPLAFSEAFGLVRLTFPDQSVTLWGAEMLQGNAGLFARNLAIFLGVLSAIAAVFACAGAPLGWLFGRAPVLRAYAADLGGSLVGVIAFTVVAWTESGPGVWLALGVLPFVWLTRCSRAAVSAVAIIGLAQYSAKSARFSPYNRIELVRDAQFLRLDVNREFHQYLHDLSDARLAGTEPNSELRSALHNLRAFYDLPFVLNFQRSSALIVGGGTGNDAQAALRNGYRAVTSVDIDAQILAIGRELHPEQPYSNPRAATVTEDARSFFEKYRGPRFDAVCFGLLDSHAMASAMSTLRLDNYVYTEEGIRAAWRHVAPGGHLSLAMSCNSGEWFFERFYWTVAKATGREPIAIHNPIHGGSVTFIVPTADARFDVKPLEQQRRIHPSQPITRTLTLSDDWPFPYLRPAAVPWGYLTVIACVLGLAALAVRPVFGIGRANASFDWPMFLLGAAFLLLETRGVTSLSLLLGSTWIVNSAVFGGVLVMVLLGNLVVQRAAPRALQPWFVALFAAVALLALFPLGWLQALPISLRGAVGGLLTGLPVGIAGVIVPMLLARSKQPAAALGSNLLGAVLGGCLEYYSMFGGMRSTAIMALVLYLLAFLLVRKRTAEPANVSVAGEITAEV
jgi:SAM-dependent methyltransferase